MALINYKSSQIKLNIPNKVLPVEVTAISGSEYWPHANGSGDPWYSGSPTKKYYRWEITFSVTPQSHGSHLTRDDFTYNGLDIVVGDWVAGATSGQCLKIISIAAKTTTSVTCVVEDWLRYNTFKNVTGNGIFNIGSAIVFSLNENGLPMVDPLPGTISEDFYATVMSRFQYLNPLLNYVLEQPNHNFSKGDVVVSTSTGFAKANNTTMAKSIGVVTESGPGPNFFIISPNNRIIDFEPSIPGNRGDYIYVDSLGGLTTSDTGKVAFLKIQDAIQTVLTGTEDDPTLPAGHQVAINGYVTTFSGTGNIALANIVTHINNHTANHNVIASAIPAPNNISADGPNTIYGLIGGYTPFSAYINTGSGNTLINFTSNGSQYSGVASPEDMKTDIDAAGIANLTVIANDNTLTLSELNGNTILIVNANADTGGYYFVGNANISGLNATTPATTTNRLQLSRSDGGEILIYEGTEYFRINTGIASGHTGMYPLALNVEEGLRSGTVRVVATIAARDGLAAQVGDQAHVLNAGNGEWALYLYDGSSWVQISNQDSSTVDAKTLTTTFTMPVAGAGNSTTNLLGNISPGRKITGISFEINTPFSGYAGVTLPNIEIGTIANASLFVNSTRSDLTDSTQFMINPEYLYPGSESQDLQIRARCNHYQSSAGNVTVKLTYV